MKIYSDDPLVKYKNSTINPERTKAEIDGVLAEWQVKDVYWHWDPQHNDVFVQFKISESIDGLPVNVAVKVACPIVWDHARPRARPPTPEAINWRINMRAMWWFIYNSLNMAYVMQSDKVTAFLPYIAGGDGNKTLRDWIIPKLAKNGVPELDVLPGQKNSRVVDVPLEETK